MPIIQAPQSKVISDRWILGPSCLTTTVLAGWKMMYVTKKVRVMTG